MATINKNKLLNILKPKSSEKVISIRENGLADANFIITNLMLDIFAEKANRMCLVIMHNTVGHYHNVGKRIGYDLLSKIRNGYVTTIEPLKSLYEQLGSTDANDNTYLSTNKEDIAKKLFLNIKCKIDSFLKDEAVGKVYLVIDDISHLLDLGIDIKYIITFLKYCIALTTDREVYMIVNCHISPSNVHDEIISNALTYVSDLNIEISNLKTGISRDVSGILKVVRHEQNMPQLNENIYHYKAYDREIKVFAPGESVFNLRK